jgi:protein SCO1/2
MKGRLTILLLTATVAAAIVSAVALNRRSTATVTPRPAGVRTFQVNGRVRSVDSAAKTLAVAHDEIPGYMPAMTMPLQIKDAALLSGLRSGDEIHFELSVTDNDSWISHLERISSGIATVSTQGAGSTRSSEAENELHKGESVPDFALTDQNGKPLRLSDYRGKAVVLTFIYTRCPLPNFCPLISRNFQALQERLSKAVPGMYRLLSISTDPKFDSPEVLKNYAALYHADEKYWTFATGSEEQINSVATLFGLVHEPEGGMISHNLRTALIGADGRLVHVWKSNVWTPYEVQRMLEESAPGKAIAKAH